ncbi:tail protein X [Pseudomonas sp. RIT-PI-S]|uniref:tail protein X n=1 Tax=Pseudomonas sp. RIT-PI-S TaxID=3035295 RepID=UPI0021DA4D7B|nr:tail protein X [Pseudomonas sp. RIT-PI-S]
MARQALAQQGDTVDALCWRAYGRTAGMVERVLEANPGLADHGAVLPHGTPVQLPDDAPLAERKEHIQLWT